jgi:hypothetical protein
MNIEDIPSIPDREKRFEEITVDCYDEYEVLSAFEVYLTDALRTPFGATYGAPGTSQAEPVTVLRVSDTDEREGVHLSIRRSNGYTYDVLADQIWADEAGSANAIVLDDYRAYVAGGGLPIDEYEDEEE